ncbi:MAG: cobalamin-dependent protein [Ignavibacteria bacterium]
MNTVLSSKQVAEILGVNESSVKRWSDSGMLSCYKTPGGHRKFKKEDLLLFSSKYSFELKSDINDRSRENHQNNGVDFKFIVDSLYRKLFVASESEITDFLYSLHLSGINLVELYDNVIAKTMFEVGEKWKHKEITVDQEHIAANKIIKSLIRLHDKIAPIPFNGLTALCGSLEGELHELPLLSVNNVLNYYGWKVIYIGANVPVKALQSGINEHKPDIVCISATIINNRKKFMNDTGKLYAATKTTGSKLILGGIGVNKMDTVSLKTDAILKSTDELIKYLKQNFLF